MRRFIVKENYKSKLSLIETEIAIKFIKDRFEDLLAKKLNLIRVSAPLFVAPKTGLNDNLNGYERPVRFDVLDLKNDAEIVQSLAKWKRNALKRYGFSSGSGIYTDMNAIRRDEELDSIHSIYVDQWDWELMILLSDRNLDFLKSVVNNIYSCLNEIDEEISSKYSNLEKKLPKDITFISSEELLKLYPNKAPKEREDEITRKHKAVFIYQIGWPLSDGNPHDGRACDYDDWTLNGDLLVWDETLGISLELSSMGIRVDEESLKAQAIYKQEEDKLYTPYAKSILNKELPYTIGGGIGQSRLCMFFLEKIHIGEVQASLWSEEDVSFLASKGVDLL